MSDAAGLDNRLREIAIRLREISTELDGAEDLER